MICCATAAGCYCAAVTLRKRKRLAASLVIVALVLTAYHFWPREPLSNPPMCHGR